MTGPHASELHHVGTRRPSPRGESNSRPRDPKSRVPRQRRLRGSTVPPLSVVLCARDRAVVSPRRPRSAPLSGANKVNVPRASPDELARDGRGCQARASGRPVFPGPRRVVRVRGRVMRAKASGHRRTESRRVVPRDSPSGDYCPVQHADRVANTGHPRLLAGKRAVERV